MSNELSLKEFIKESIKNIADGIYEAKEEISNKYQNFPVAPATMNNIDVTKEQIIKFDIAVTSSEIKTGQIGGNIGINVVNISGEGELKKCAEKLNRIQFEVPFYAQALTNQNRMKKKRV